MSTLVFKLTLRPNELLELYPETKGFITFWRRNRLYLLIVIALLIMETVQLSTRKFNLYGMVLAILAALIIIPLVKSAVEFIQSRKAIFLWVEDSKKFQHHRIELSDSSFTYLRDDEHFETAFTAVTEVIQNSDYIFIQHGKENIIFPAKSFDEGEYERFVQEFRKRRKAALKV